MDIVTSLKLLLQNLPKTLFRVSKSGIKKVLFCCCFSQFLFVKEPDLTHATELFLFDGLRDADLFERIIGGDLAQVNLVPAAILDSRLIAGIDGACR